MKSRFFILLLVVAMGVIVFSGCKKKYTTTDSIKNQIIGKWECSDSRYCQKDNNITLSFNIDNVIINVNTDSRCVFNNGDYKYNISEDTLRIMLQNGNLSYTITMTKQKMELHYLGVVGAHANEQLPALDYKFKKIKQ